MIALLIISVSLGQPVRVAVAPKPVYVNLGQMQYAPSVANVVPVHIGRKVSK